MFFLFGFGHRTVKNAGPVAQTVCPNCHNTVNRQAVKVTSWFTLFFIPCIPYSFEHMLVCPVCRRADEISGDEFKSYLNNTAPVEAAQNAQQNPQQNLQQSSSQNYQAPVNDDSRFRGKTETQINYLKQMAEIEAERAQKRQTE